MKVRAYLRKSTEVHQAHSLETQEKRIKEYCGLRGLNDIVCYTDIMSGTKDDRPEFNKMLEEAQRGDLVVVYSLSRLSRSVKTCLEVIEKLESNGIKIASVSEAIDTSSPMGRFQIQILASLSELEVSILRSRITDAMRRLIADKKLKRKPKYGWMKNPNGGEHIKNEGEQMIIEKIRKMYIEDKKTITEISQILQSEGIQIRKSKKIYTNVVKTILMELGVYDF